MTCRICNGHDLMPVMDFGRVALAGGFLKPDMFHVEQRHRLELVFCSECATLQVKDSIPPDELFSGYFYRTSTSRTMREHFATYAADLMARFMPIRVVEIGCNDGALMNALTAPEVIGIDPSGAEAEGTVIEGFFDKAMASRLGHADVVVANNVFAHIENIHDFTAGVSDMIGDTGVFVFEVHYLGDMMRDGQYDAIYHEHLFYWSLLSVEYLLGLHRMQVFDVQPQRTHGGSMRFYACRTGTRRIMPQVTRLRVAEKMQLLDFAPAFSRFAEEAMEHRRQLCGLINRLEGQTIAAYGASGRANTLLQWCGLELEYIIDDCPGKQGFYTPGTHISILPASALADNPPDWLLVTAWTFLDEIAERIKGYRGGLILPFPEVRAIPAQEKVAA